MILAMNVGNTHIVFGVMEGETLINSFKLTTATPRTSDEYGVAILGMLEEKQIAISNLEAAIMASVVPDIMYSLKNSVKKYLGIEPLIVGAGLKTGLAIRTDNPKEMGAGRIANCVAAYDSVGEACIAIDFGTATTYDVVNDKGELIAAITSPGIRISADALWKSAAQLPQIEIRKTKHILDAKNTVTSMQTGLVYGYIGQVEYIVKKVKEQLGKQEIKVIATGGLAKVIQEGTDVIDQYESFLTLRGLSKIYEKNR